MVKNDGEGLSSEEYRRIIKDIERIKVIQKYHEEDITRLSRELDDINYRLNNIYVEEARLQSNRAGSLDMIKWIIPVFLTIVTILVSRAFHL